MTSVAESQSRLPAVLALALVMVVAASSFGVSQWIVSERQAEGAAIADSLERERSGAAEPDERTKRLTALLAEVEQQVKTRPLDSVLVRSAGNIAYDLGLFDKASQYYETFLEKIDGSDVTVRIDYGYAVFESGDPVKGMSIVETVLRYQPRNQIALYNLGVMALRNSDVETGTRWLQRCRDTDATSDVGRKAEEILTSLASAS